MHNCLGRLIESHEESWPLKRTRRSGALDELFVSACFRWLGWEQPHLFADGVGIQMNAVSAVFAFEGDADPGPEGFFFGAGFDRDIECGPVFRRAHDL